MFHHFSAHFDPFTSIWEILVKMKMDMKNVDFIPFSYKYLICGFNSEISTWKLLFQKVQMILYILPIYHFFSSCILNELRSFEDTCKIIRFGHKCFKYFTSELMKYTVGLMILLRKTTLSGRARQFVHMLFSFIGLLGGIKSRNINLTVSKFRSVDNTQNHSVCFPGELDNWFTFFLSFHGLLDGIKSKNINCL